MIVGANVVLASLLTALGSSNGGSPQAPPSTPAPDHLEMIPHVGLFARLPEQGGVFGVRLGAIVGGFVTPRVSLNGQLAFDTSHTGAHKSGMLAFAPLVHVTSRGPYVGPLLGLWHLRRSDVARVATGWTVGVNAGGFMRLNQHVALGALLTYSRDASVASKCDFAFVCKDRAVEHVISWALALAF